MVKYLLLEALLLRHLLKRLDRLNHWHRPIKSGPLILRRLELLTRWKWWHLLRLASIGSEWLLLLLKVGRLIEGHLLIVVWLKRLIL